MGFFNRRTSILSFDLVVLRGFLMGIHLGISQVCFLGWYEYMFENISFTGSPTWLRDETHYIIHPLSTLQILFFLLVRSATLINSWTKNPSTHPLLGDGFKYFSFSPLPGEIIQFYEYFSNGLVQPPTRSTNGNVQPGFPSGSLGSALIRKGKSSSVRGPGELSGGNNRFKSVLFYVNKIFVLWSV